MRLLGALRPVVFWLCLLITPAFADGSDVIVAFRDDAAPFSSRAEDGSYTGFLADLCEAAVVGAGYTIADRVPITAADRFYHTADAAVDLICDPTTLTRERAKTVDFSPVLFIANSSFLEASTATPLSEQGIDAASDCAKVHKEKPRLKLYGVGMVGKTTASATYKLAREQQFLAETEEDTYCVIAFPTHIAAISAICDGQISFYFGDVDILRVQLASRKGCDASLNGKFRAYEPYSLAIPSSDPVFRRKLVAALYELFSNDKAQQAYIEAFGDLPKSPALDMLFRINNIPAGRSE